MKTEEGGSDLDRLFSFEHVKQRERKTSTISLNLQLDKIVSAPTWCTSSNLPLHYCCSPQTDRKVKRRILYNT